MNLGKNSNEIIQEIERLLPTISTYEEMEKLCTEIPPHPPNGRTSPVGQLLTPEDEILYDQWRKMCSAMWARRHVLFHGQLERGLKFFGYAIEKSSGTKKFECWVTHDRTVVPEIWRHRERGWLGITYHKPLPEQIIDQLLQAGRNA